MNKICGIYKITSPSGMIYIGQSRDIERRIIEYRKIRCKSQQKLCYSIIKYGWDSHTFELIHECQEIELNELEQHYIKQFDTFNTEHGLNLTSGGDTFKLSDETRLKISKSSMGNTKWVGRKHSDESKLKMSITRKGRKASDESKLKMSITRKGRKAWNVGIKHSDETKEKMRKSAPKYHSREHAINSGIGHRGLKLSNETKEKMSISKKGNQIRLGAKLSDETKEKIFNKKCHTYEIYDNNNCLICKFKSNFNKKMKELKLPVIYFRKSHQNNEKVSEGKYKNWYVIKL